MGLNCSHGCFDGPYSQFMEWREWLNLFVMMDRMEAGDEAAEPIRNMGATREAIMRAWAEGMYDDQSVPINVLMLHSDCEGEIAPEVCGPLAKELKSLMDRHMPKRGTYDKMRPPTERFLRGLRTAAKKNEPVLFR